MKNKYNLNIQFFAEPGDEGVDNNTDPIDPVEKTFTQKEVNNMMANERKTFKQEKDELTKSFADLKAQSDIQTNDIKKYQTNELKYNALAKNGLSNDYIGFIQGDDAESIEKNVAKLVELAGANASNKQKAPLPNPDKGTPNKDIGDALEEALKKRGNK